MDSRLPPGAYSRRSVFSGTPNISLPYVVPALVGASLGSGVSVQCEAVTKTAVDAPDALSHAASGSGLLRSVLRVSDTCDGIANYFEGVQFQVTNDMIDWGLAAVLSSPALDTAVSGSDGTLASGDYYYVVTTVDQSAVDESNWVTGMDYTSGGLPTNGSITIGWEEIPNATGYKVYRTSTFTSGYPDFSGADAGLLATVTNGASYTDDGTDTIVSGVVPPTDNETHDEPASGDIYYVDYQYSSFEFDVPRRFTSLTDVINTYGYGSQLSVMAEFAMSTIPNRGNQAPAVWCVAAGDNANPTAVPGYADYQEALAALEQVEREQLIVVVGKTSANMRQAVKLHCETMSDLEHKKERIGFVFAPNNTIVGSSGDATSLIGMASALASKRVSLIAADSGAVKGYVQDVGDTTRTEGVLAPEYVAAAVAGRVSALTDSATPLTRKQIVGLTGFAGSQGRVYNRTELLQLSEGGVCVIQYRDDSLWLCYKGITTEQSIQDDMELSVVLATDTLAMAWREAIDPTVGSAQASLIGSKLTPGLLQAVRVRTQAVLDDLVGKGIINSYDTNSITAEQNSTTLTQVDVSFNFEPIFPVNTIILTFSTSFSITG